MKGHRILIVAALLAAACGLPLYLTLDRAQWLPLALRDRPWPLEAVLGAATAVTLVGAWRALHAGRGRALALSCAVVALASAIALVVVARFTRYRLPHPPPELTLGQVVDFTLPDDAGRPVQLSSLRGRPALLYFYRGSY
jgi:hypothetical protein